MIIAIDGPAGAGKSTVGRAVADGSACDYLDTGAMYRAVAFAALRRGVAVSRRRAPSPSSPGDGPRRRRRRRVIVDGVDATAEIRGREVTEAVSAVAANTPVREELRPAPAAWADERGGGVIEGRDIGTVVFPDAELKLYVTASPRVRAERRVREIGGDVDDVETSIAERDRRDMSRRRAAAARRRGRRRRHHRPHHRRGRRPGRERRERSDRRDQGRVVPRREGLASRAAYSVGPAARRRVHPPVDPAWRSKGRAHPGHGRVRARAGAPLEHRHADLIVPDPPAAAIHGQGLAVEAPGGGVDPVGARRVPGHRGAADREALKRCIAVLEAGEPLVLFPEGERKSGSDVQPLFDGAAYVALKAGVPIVPVGIGGSEAVMPKGAKFIHPRKVHVIVGPPIPPAMAEGGARAAPSCTT